MGQVCSGSSKKVKAKGYIGPRNSDHTSSQSTNLRHVEHLQLIDQQHQHSLLNQNISVNAGVGNGFPYFRPIIKVYETIDLGDIHQIFNPYWSHDDDDRVNEVINRLTSLEIIFLKVSYYSTT